MNEIEYRYFWNESDKNTNNPTYEEHRLFCLQMKENINSAQIKTIDLTNLNNDFGNGCK